VQYSSFLHVKIMPGKRICLQIKRKKGCGGSHKPRNLKFEFFIAVEVSSSVIDKYNDVDF